MSEIARPHGEAASQIADAIREQILSGELAPGDRIRQEEIAQQFTASRLPVREAIRMLDAEGLLTVVPNTGAWVTELTSEQCQELYLMRERLEPLLLTQNVELLPIDRLDELTSLADAMEATTDVEEFLRLDRQFHLLPLGFAPSEVLRETVFNLWNRTQHYRRSATRQFYSDGDRGVHLDHRLIVNAMGRRDASEAEAALAQHIRRSRIELERHPEIFHHAH